MPVFTENGFMRVNKFICFFGICFFSLSLHAGYIVSPHSKVAASWFEKGKAEAKSKLALGYFQKVIDLTINSSQAGDRILLADSYYFKGFHYYYYQYDFTAIKTGSGKEDESPYDEESTKDLIAEGEEMAKMTDDERRGKAKEYYLKALNINSNHSDAMYELGVYYFWKGAFEDAQKNYGTAKSNYTKAFNYFNNVISRDKKCSTAYEFRGRIFWRAGRTTHRDRDFTYCSKLRENPNEPYYDVPSFYEHTNYTGAKMEATSSSSWIGDWWNDKISSYKLPYFWAVRMYQHSNYGGTYFTAYGAYNDSTLTNNSMTKDASWNDQVSSYKIWLYRTGYGSAVSLGSFTTTPPGSFSSAFLTSDF